MSASAAEVLIVIVNWNGAPDTLECLESVFRLEYPSFHVVVVDNHSSDNSVEKICSWAEGNTLSDVVNPGLVHLSRPPVPKPINYSVLESDADANLRQASHKQLTILRTRSNLGFAGGNNAALSLLLSDTSCKYAWLLNNDTVVDRETLSFLVRTMKDSPRAGICGSTLLHYDSPDTVQACGGAVYNRWTARIRHLGANRRWAQRPGMNPAETMDYVVGASMLVSRRFLQDVGLMNEEYFLYFEEIDWARRARRKYTLGYAPESLVYHKQGLSAGANNRAGSRSALADYYGARNRMRVTARFFPYALPTVFMALVASALDRAWHRKWENIGALLRALVGLPFRNSVSS